MKSRLIVPLCITLVCMGSLAGCAVDPGASRFPDPQSSTLQGGTFVNVANLRNVGPGLTKYQIYDLLGPPHFHEGVFHVRVWNYLFNFRRAGTTVTCQYQIQFDDDKRVSKTLWKDPACEDYVRAKAPDISESSSPKTAETERSTLESDTLFEFGQYSLDHMLPGGKASLDNVIERIRRHPGVTSITVTGHADRIGEATFNQRLSLARADAVRDYLVRHGVDSRLIHTEGAGSSQSISHCPQGRGSAEIVCLQPDRRVSITVKGHNR